MEKRVCDYYANVKETKVDWLWYPYIPMGKLTIIQGDPGEGKSTFLLNLVSLLTRGLPMPDGYRLKGPGVAIYQCSEDGIADTIKPRLIQAGADCEKVAYIVDDDLSLTMEDGRIDAAIKETGASLFIIDPLQAFIPSDADMINASSMRSVLGKLARVAEVNHCAIVLVGHQKKGSAGKQLYRGLGSIDIAAIARSVLGISRDESNPSLRYMYPIKSSLAAEGPAISFTIKEGGGIEWEGQYFLNTAELTDTVTVKTSKQEKARAKILQLLLEGAMPSKEVFEALEELDIGRRTVEMVKKELGIEAFRIGGIWYWRLPEKTGTNGGKDGDG